MLSRDFENVELNVYGVDYPGEEPPHHITGLITYI